MKYPINTKNLTEDVEFYSEVLKMNKEAADYIQSFGWCKNVKDSNLYLNLGSILCIFLFEIDNSASNEDNFLWLMVGDIPPMYLDVFGSKTIKEVLTTYADLATDWITNVESGEMAEMLKRRVNQIKNSIRPNIEDIELPPALMTL